MENDDPKATLRQDVRDVLNAFKAGDFGVEIAADYLIELIETGELTQYAHIIRLRAHD